MYTHRLFLKDGHTFMTDADRALMEQHKVDAQQSAAAAAEAAAKAQEHAATVDTDRIDASIALKGDSLSYDRENKMLYLASNGKRIGEGIPIIANINDAILTIENTTGWTTKTVSLNADCVVSFNWSSIENGSGTGSGTITVLVENESRYVAKVDQGENTIDISDHLSVGENRVSVIIEDFYKNSQNLLFIITVYDPATLKSTRLVERTLTGDYTNDRVTRIGISAFSGLTFGKLELPNATDLDAMSLSECKATELELSNATKIVYMMFNGCDIGVVKLPSVVQADGRCFDGAAIKRVVFNSLETMGGDMVRTICFIQTFDFHKLTSLWDLFSRNDQAYSLIIRTPTVCALQNEATDTKATLYVPSALVADYKAATNWSAMADRIFAIEDHPEICEVNENV